MQDKSSLIIFDKLFTLVWEKELDSVDNLMEVINKLTKLDLHQLKLLLIGDLGAGKTTLTRSLLHSLGIIKNISSPTFNLVNYYNINNLSAVHADLYRLVHEEELDDINLIEDLDQPGLVLIEWGEKFPLLVKKVSAVLMIKVTKKKRESFVFIAPHNSDKSYLLIN